MKTLFESQRTTLDDALRTTAASLNAFGETHRHWRLAFSGGKDSTATAAAVAYLTDAGLVKRPDTLGLMYADTRLELPNLHAAAQRMMGDLRRRGWDVQTVLPDVLKRFFVMMFGRGIPPSHSGFRWCTGVLKVDPMAELMRSIKGDSGEKLLVITGMRIGESANRDKRITLACGKNGGECGAGWYEETTPADVADVLSPILHWRTCHVWDWLMLGRKKHGLDCSLVAEVYDQDAEGSAAEVLSRTGCLSCPVASRDYALERTIRKPEWAYLQPLMELRTLYEELSRPCNRLKKIERRKDGSISKRPMRLGPLVMPARRTGIDTVLSIQARVNAARGSRPEVILIDDEELACINGLIAADTWPQGWNGDEWAGNELIEDVRPGGFSLPVLNFGD
ncbi:phosphoadenosine phosphosulfate reductase family protein [Sphingomonas sp.]|uniref:phosphoadenosine phosphosulfate reductase domain-containing protein n=1 Tax=Sphingomonas sp. TaxID=28214 RepID=UPI0025DFEFBA|nr:phosphoadenosine phosphosulfate reductase family protein [Sphingomonas sp.]